MAQIQFKQSCKVFGNLGQIFSIMESDIKPIEVYAGELWQATTVKNILEGNHIQAFLENEYLGTIAPWRVEAGGSGAVKVIVSNRDVDLAVKLIDEFNTNTFIDETND